MHSNEILINLENHKNLSDSELVGGLIELTKRADENRGEVDWNEHPITSKSLNDLKKRLPRMSAKHVSQTQRILQGLRITDTEFWQLNSVHVIRLLHKYKSR